MGTCMTKLKDVKVCIVHNTSGFIVDRGASSPTVSCQGRYVACACCLPQAASGAVCACNHMLVHYALICTGSCSQRSPSRRSYFLDGAVTLANRDHALSDKMCIPSGLIRGNCSAHYSGFWFGALAHNSVMACRRRPGHLGGRAAIAVRAAGTAAQDLHMQDRFSPAGSAPDPSSLSRPQASWLPSAADFMRLWVPALGLIALTGIFDARGEPLSSAHTSV